jgi:hypothetical protein
MRGGRPALLAAEGRAHAAAGRTIRLFGSLTATSTTTYLAGATTTVVLTTTGTSIWTVPSDWNSSNNTIEVIAGGGSGGVGVQPSGVAKGAGGAGGAYEIKSNVILTPGATVDYFIGAGALATAMAAI